MIEHLCTCSTYVTEGASSLLVSAVILLFEFRYPSILTSPSAVHRERTPGKRNAPEEHRRNAKIVTSVSHEVPCLLPGAFKKKQTWEEINIRCLVYKGSNPHPEAAASYHGRQKKPKTRGTTYHLTPGPPTIIMKSAKTGYRFFVVCATGPQRSPKRATGPYRGEGGCKAPPSSVHIRLALRVE